MSTQELTFAFAGDERVGAGVSGLLLIYTLKKIHALKGTSDE